MQAKNASSGTMSTSRRIMAIQVDHDYISGLCLFCIFGSIINSPYLMGVELGGRLRKPLTRRLLWCTPSRQLYLQELWKSQRSQFLDPHDTDVATKVAVVSNGDLVHKEVTEASPLLASASFACPGHLSDLKSKPAPNGVSPLAICQKAEVTHYIVIS